MIGDRPRFFRASEREWAAIDCVERVEDQMGKVWVYLKSGKSFVLDTDKRDELFRALGIPSGETFTVEWLAGPPAMTLTSTGPIIDPYR